MQTAFDHFLQHDSEQSDFWLTLRALLHVTMNGFGSPSELAAQQFIKRADRRLLLCWLRGIEIIVRRLLLVLAAHLWAAGHVVLRELKGRRAIARDGRASGHGRGGFGAEDSSLWSVTVAVLPKSGDDSDAMAAEPDFDKLFGSKTSAHSAIKRIADDGDFVPCMGVAERLEALLRVARDPEPYALRLARLMTRDQTKAEMVAGAIVAEDLLVDLIARDGDRRDTAIMPGLWFILRDIHDRAIEAALSFKPPD